MDVPAPEPEPDAGGGLFATDQLDHPDRQALLTAVLFSAGESVAAGRLAEFFGRTEVELGTMAEELAAELRPLGLDIIPAAGGFKLVTAAHWDAHLAQFHRTVKKTRLSQSALEILAVIAYEQPVTRQRIDELRQVNSESTVRGLLEKRLITVAGRAETPGRPFIYRTTELFLETFGLAGLEDLPPRPASLKADAGLKLGSGADDEAQPGLEALPGFDDAGSDELED